MKKIVAMALVLTMVGVPQADARTYNSKTNTYTHNAKLVDYPIYVGNDIKNTEFYKLNVNGSTYLSLRDIASLLGIEIVWNSNTKSIYINEKFVSHKNITAKNFGKGTVKATEANFPVYVNGDRKIPERYQLVVDGRTYLSIRDIATMLNVPIDWDNNVKKISIGSNTVNEVSKNNTDSQTANNQNTENQTVSSQNVNNQSTENQNGSSQNSNNQTSNNIAVTVSNNNSSNYTVYSNNGDCIEINFYNEEKELQNDMSKNTPEEMLRLVNEFRTENGKKPLKLITDSQIQDFVKLRATEIATSFSHTRPDGSKFNSNARLREKFRMHGENISAGRLTVKETVEALKNSPGHRANMLNDDFTHMYSAYYYDENSTYIHHHVQLFTGMER